MADQVGFRLRQHILRSGLRPGDRLPSYRTLAQELGVAYMTVKRGVEGLARDGIVTSFHGKGLFVGGGLARRPQALRHALLVFPASMHHVLSYAYAGETVRGALLALEEHGIGSSIRFMVGEGIIHGDYVDRLHADAVILIGVEDEEYLRKAATWGRPAVAVDYCSAAVPMDFVACDNRSATRRLLEHIACLGHRRIAYLGSGGERTLWMKGGRTESLVQRSSDSRERREGVRAAAAALGLPAPRVLLAPEGSSFDAPLTQAFRRASDRPTALVLESDLAAPGAMGGLASHGLRVPQDVSICAVAGASALAECPGLTYCRFDFLDMGRKAVTALRESFAQPGEPVNRIHRIGFEFVKGKTTAKAQERRTRRGMMHTVLFACLAWLSVAIRSVAAEPAEAGKPAAAAYRQVTSFAGCEDYSWVPRELAKGPAFRSAKVRYNIWVLGDGRKSVMTMAWDESGGTGTGYDTLYVDRNFNRDLTEDGERFALIRSEKEPKHSFPPLDGIKEADGNKTFSLKLCGWSGDYTIGYPSAYRASWPGGGVSVGPLPGDVRLAWANDLKAAPVYRLGGQMVYFLNDKLPGADMGTWTAGDTATVCWYGALLGGSPGIQLRTPVQNKVTILRVLNKSGAVMEDIPFEGHCTCGGGFTATLLVPTRVPPGRHLLVGRVPETRTEYLYPVAILNPDFGKPIADPALAALRTRFPDAKVRFAALRRAGAGRQELDPGYPDENVVPARVYDNALLSKHREGGCRERNAGSAAFLQLGNYILFDKPLAGLLRFGLGGIPKETRILGAELRLTLVANQFIHTGDKARLSAYAMRRPWNETPQTNGYSCWLGPACTAKGDPTSAWIVAGEAWGAPGCEDTEKDRFAEAAAHVEIGRFPAKIDPADAQSPLEKRRLVHMDLTDLVRRWHAGDLPNHGVLLKLAGGSLDIASSEFAADRPAYRPTLVIAYEGPAPVPALTLLPEEDSPTATTCAKESGSACGITK